jgi:hypothetical protein
MSLMRLLHHRTWPVWTSTKPKLLALAAANLTLGDLVLLLG